MGLRRKEEEEKEEEEEEEEEREGGEGALPLLWCAGVPLVDNTIVQYLVKQQGVDINQASFTYLKMEEEQQQLE